MADSMAFPKTMEEFIDGYSFNDREKVYTNGIDLVPVFRVIQGFGHYEQEIRNKAIDEFVEMIELEILTMLTSEQEYRIAKKSLDEIAVQMKGV